MGTNRNYSWFCGLFLAFSYILSGRIKRTILKGWETPPPPTTLTRRYGRAVWGAWDLLRTCPSLHHATPEGLGKKHGAVTTEADANWCKKTRMMKNTTRTCLVRTSGATSGATLRWRPLRMYNAIKQNRTEYSSPLAYREAKQMLWAVEGKHPFFLSLQDEKKKKSKCGTAANTSFRLYLPTTALQERS